MKLPDEFEMPALDGELVYAIIRREDNEMVGTGTSETFAHLIAGALGRGKFRVEKWSVSTQCPAVTRKVQV